MNITTLQVRIHSLARKHRLCHLGSCFSVLPILMEIYSKEPESVVILSNGHAGLALYAVLEAVFQHDAEELLTRHGVHPIRDEEHHIYCSTGSLGMGLAVAVGYAMAGRKTHVVVSDGECAEGIVWESLAFIADHRDLPIDVWMNMNGWGACRRIERDILQRRLVAFLRDDRLHTCWTTNAPMPDSLSAHYEVPT